MMIGSADRVLVTGAGGFIGSHLTEALVRTGADVCALVHYNSRNDWGHLEDLDEGLLKSIRVVSGDVRDAHFVRSIPQGRNIVFHLAALIAIPNSSTPPAAMWQQTSRVLSTSCKPLWTPAWSASCTLQPAKSMARRGTFLSTKSI